VAPTDPADDSVRLLREIAAGPRTRVLVGDLDRGTARRLLAVKLFVKRFPRDAETLFRLRDLGRQLASLGHPSIVAPLEVVDSEGHLGLVTPYVDGIDLFDLCEVLWDTGQRLPARIACAILGEVASALDVALRGVPAGATEPLERHHRDLRPTNVMLDREGRVCVLDLGTGLTATVGRTARAEVLKKGLSRYLSPARREGKRDATGDVYALGVMGIELSRGAWLRRLRARNPDHDRHLAEVVARMSDVGFRSEGDELALRNLLLRMVAHDPDARPTPQEVAETMRGLAERATGRDLLDFADRHVVPWVEAVPDEPDDGMIATWARLLDGPAEAPAAGPLVDEAVDEGGEWIETGEGWRPGTGDHDVDDDDDDDFDDGPPEPTPSRPISVRDVPTGPGALAAAAAEASLPKDPETEILLRPPRREEPVAPTPTEPPTARSTLGGAPLPASAPAPIAAPVERRASRVALLVVGALGVAGIGLLVVIGAGLWWWSQRP
jgi:serine/threonine protein kinase